jgi:hypothetical protein
MNVTTTNRDGSPRKIQVSRSSEVITEFKRAGGEKPWRVPQSFLNWRGRTTTVRSLYSSLLQYTRVNYPNIHVRLDGVDIYLRAEQLDKN